MELNFCQQIQNHSGGFQKKSHDYNLGRLKNAAGFMMRTLPMYETPEQLKNPLLNPQKGC